MLEQQRNWGLFFCFLSAGFLLAGCGQQLRLPRRICPGKESKAEALSVLSSRAQNLMPLVAKGRCIWTHFAKGKKPGKESFTVKIWINPPCQIRVHGDVAFNAKGLDLGANKKEYWVAIKPEYNSYYWGNWSETNHPGNIMLSPKIMLEAFGASGIESGKSWILSHENGFDVLTKLNSNSIVRRIYLYSCDELVTKIEHFDITGRVIVTVELDKYKKVSVDFVAPTRIKIIASQEKNEKNSFEITLTSITPKEFTGEKKSILFGPPSSKRFKHVYKNIDGTWVEQIE